MKLICETASYNHDATAGLSESHAWNVVRADDGNYYAVDVCWNDTDGVPAYKTDYLNIGEEIMSATNSRKESHTYQEEYAAWIPAIAKDSYVSTEEDLPQFGAPENLRVQESGATSVTLAWDEVADANRFQVAIFTDASRSEIRKSIYFASKTGCSINQLLPNTVYELGVCAQYRESGEAVSSNWAYLTVQTADGEPEKSTMEPTNIKTTSRGVDGAYTTWSGIKWNTRNTDVEVCRYTDASCTEMEEGYPRTADNYSYHFWSDLEEGKTYYFGVRAAESGMVEMVCSDWVNFSYTHNGTT